MKKLLLASTALMAFATAAAAETGVKISGLGRFGLTYDEGRLTNQTRVETRLRFNFDATTETDSGVTFGGRIRLQYDEGNANSTVSPAYVYASYDGLRVEVGNSNTAFDSAALLYDSELGLTGKSFGDSQSTYFSYSTGGFGGNINRMGVYVSYDINGFSVKASYVTPDQTVAAGVNEETSIALSYENDMFVVSAAAANDAAGIANNDPWFIGAAYKGLPNATIGLNYIEEGTAALGSTTVLYGNYTMDAWTFKAYIANNDAVGNLSDTAFGIGADYDLGGAKLTGGIQYGYTKDTYADLGVSFSF